MTTSGQVVTVTPVIPATLNQYDDTEGLSYDPATRTLYATFSNDFAIGSFHVETDFQLTWQGTLFMTGPLGLPNGDGADGIAYDPASGNLFLVTPEGPGSMVFEVTTSGSVVNSFQIDLAKARGIDVLPNGNLLLSNARPASNGGGLFEYTRTGSPVTSPIRAAAAAKKAPSVESLTESQLGAIVDFAANHWADVGQDTSRLTGMTYRIVDLPDQILGEVVANTIYIDVNGAGHGWFVDQTPEDNREFNFDSGLVANEASAATDRFDLLSVVMHEFGHVLGFNHAHDRNDLMNDSLLPGRRRLPLSAVNFTTRFDARAAAHVSFRLNTITRFVAPNVAGPNRVDRLEQGFDSTVINPQRKRALDALFLESNTRTPDKATTLVRTQFAGDQTELRPKGSGSVSAVDQFFNDSSFEL
jgi:hypothetical protein